MVGKVVGIALAFGVVAGCYDDPPVTPNDAGNTADAALVADASDQIAPRITSIVPLPNSNYQAGTSTIGVTFSELVNVAPSSVRLERDGIAVPGVLTFDPGTLTASIKPDAVMASSATYQIVVTSDVVDLAGNHVVPNTSNFTILDTVGPTVVNLGPSTGASGVNVLTEVTAEFNERVVGPSNSVTLTAGSIPISGVVELTSTPPRAVFRPTGQLAPYTLYTATLVSSITDQIGNPLAAPMSWTFMTGPDTAGPQAVSRQPGPGANTATTTPSISVRFDEPAFNIDATTFTLTQAGAPIAATVSYDPATRTASLQPTQSLSTTWPQSVYTLTLTAAITDAAGNPHEGLSWTFDTRAPGFWDY